MRIIMDGKHYRWELQYSVELELNLLVSVDDYTSTENVLADEGLAFEDLRDIRIMFETNRKAPAMVANGER